MTRDVEDLLQLHKTWAARRDPWLQHWQSLADVMHPARADFTVSSRPGEERTEEIYDGTPMMLRRSLATTIGGLLTPRQTPWFFLKAEDEALNEDEAVKAWLEDSQKRLRAAIYNRRARFTHRSSEAYNDLVAFGTSALFVGEGQDLSRLFFRSFHLKQTVLAENADGEIDTVAIEETLTARQAKQRFGEENLGAKTKEALARAGSGSGSEPAGREELFPFLWITLPREDRDTRRRDRKNMPFASIVIDVKSQHIVDEGGFQEFPWVIQRWDTTSGEPFGRSPGMIALPDSRMLMEQARTIIMAGQRAVDPPLFMPSDAFINAPQAQPGGISYYELEVAERLGRIPVDTIGDTANIPLGREMQRDTRLQLEKAFFKNVFNLPVEGPQMTATEVLERRDEFVREIGPTLGMLEDDGPAVIVERAFNVMARAGQFAEPPEAIAGREIEITFLSPVQRAMQQIEASAFARAMELVGPLAQIQPEMLDHLAGDEIMPDLPEIFGFPRKWLRGEDGVAEIRQARAEAQQAAQQAQLVSEGADVVSKLAKVPQPGRGGAAGGAQGGAPGDVLGALLGGGAGGAQGGAA